MILSKFITFCTLKGYVVSHKELPVPAWDTDAEKHFRLELQGRGYIASIKYATIGEGAAIICSSMRDCRQHVTSPLLPDATFDDIEEAFIPSK